MENPLRDLVQSISSNLNDLLILLKQKQDPSQDLLKFLPWDPTTTSEKIKYPLSKLYEYICALELSEQLNLTIKKQNLCSCNY